MAVGDAFDMMSKHPLAFEVFTEIAIINQLSTAMLQSVMPKGLTQAQFTVLSHFVRRDLKDQWSANLASALQVTRPTMTSTLARMERDGLVHIVPDPKDGRAKLVSITARGRSTFVDTVAAADPLIPMIRGIATDSELISILPVLKSMRIRLDELRD
jgi:DNA-binding MarR family transcriptional regulator